MLINDLQILKIKDIAAWRIARTATQLKDFNFAKELGSRKWPY